MAVSSPPIPREEHVDAVALHRDQRGLQIGAVFPAAHSSWRARRSSSFTRSESWEIRAACPRARRLGVDHRGREVGERVAELWLCAAVADYSTAPSPRRAPQSNGWTSTSSSTSSTSIGPGAHSPRRRSHRRRPPPPRLPRARSSASAHSLSQAGVAAKQRGGQFDANLVPRGDGGGVLSAIDSIVNQWRGREHEASTSFRPGGKLRVPRAAENVTDPPGPSARFTAERGPIRRTERRRSSANRAGRSFFVRPANGERLEQLRLRHDARAGSRAVDLAKAARGGRSGSPARRWSGPATASPPSRRRRRSGACPRPRKEAACARGRSRTAAASAGPSGAAGGRPALAAIPLAKERALSGRDDAVAQRFDVFGTELCSRAS